ncbi:MAG TPA: insulinase family protein, partial [Candidatus Binatia bacterium]|nr:insulinase family protein [Candidatus Binatia bacterium]
GPYLAYGRVLPFNEWEKRIKDVTPDQIHSLARDLLKRGRLSMSLVGNVNGLNLKKLALAL